GGDGGGARALSDRHGGCPDCGYVEPQSRDDRILMAAKRAAAPRCLRSRRRRASRRRAGDRLTFAIRDDDTWYFTEPEELARVYGDVWERVPICLATVPFAIGYERAGIPREHWHSNRAWPLGDNRALTLALGRLIAARRVTVALHGYTHQDFPSGYEVQAAPDLERRVQDRLPYLRTLLPARGSLFVPPPHALSKRGLAAGPAAPPHNPPPPPS